MYLYPFILLAAVGLALSVLVHVSALLGWPDPFESYVWGLHAGVFVVWPPAILVTQRYTRDFKQAEFWKAALRGCPRWMRTMMYACLGYAIVNFGWFMFSDFSGGAPRATDNDVRAFSGHWMAFYSAALAVMYSASRIDPYDATRKCLQGHTVSPLSNFCEQCGSPVSSASHM